MIFPIRSSGFDPTATVGITVDSIPLIVLAEARDLLTNPVRRPRLHNPGMHDMPS